jgi:glucose-6-phosphate isomerase
LWPYGEALAPLGPWWAQLVGESLGKPTARGPVGVAPIAARGPADQHSLLQLLVEGPDDALVVFVDAQGVDGPRIPAGGGGLCVAAGQSLGRVLRVERAATARALALAGRPSITLHLSAADAEGVGACLFLFEAAVVAWARLLGVNPYDQPGVQQGKDIARALL